MEAIRVNRFGDPDVLELETNVPIPTAGEGQVQIRVHSAGINPVEVYIRTGNFAIKPTLPYTPGDDVAGVVSAVGEGVTDFKIGDRVITGQAVSGSYAQYAIAPASSVQILPDVLSFDQGASIPLPYLTAYRALFHKGHGVPGETVLIHGGTGGVGMASVQLALMRGLKVIATGGTEEGRKLLTDQGVEHVLNHRDGGYLDKINEITGGKGVELIIENLANVNLGKDHQVIATGGRIILIGNRGEAQHYDATLTLAKESHISGVLIYLATPAENKESYAAIQNGIKSGKIRPVIGKRFPLAEAAAAHTDIMNTKGALGKTVLTVD